MASRMKKTGEPRAGENSAFAWLWERIGE